MLKRKVVQTVLVSAVAIMVICLLAAAISLTTQKPINKTGSSPAGLPGIQVTVVNKSTPHATPKSAITDAGGAFDLGVLPAGTYALTLRITEEAKNAVLRDKLKGIGKNAGDLKLKMATVTIEGAADGKVVGRWDFATNMAVEAPGITVQQKVESGRGAARKPPQPDVTFTADGKQKVKGKVDNPSM